MSLAAIERRPSQLRSGHVLECRPMAWVAPIYSRSRVNEAGATYIDPTVSLEDRETALAIINNRGLRRRAGGLQRP